MGLKDPWLLKEVSGNPEGGVGAAPPPPASGLAVVALNRGTAGDTGGSCFAAETLADPCRTAGC
jgi:hypothetical protein